MFAKTGWYHAPSTLSSLGYRITLFLLKALKKRKINLVFLLFNQVTQKQQKKLGVSLSANTYPVTFTSAWLVGTVASSNS